MSTHTSANLSYVGSAPGKGATSHDRNAWFTPSEYIEAARAAMGRIDLDPFSDTAANRVVQATRFFTEQDDAFTRDWAADCPQGGQRLWLNPPFGRDVIDKVVDKFTVEFKEGHFSEAIVLTNNATETQWFHELLAVASAICLPSKRIKFWNADGKAVSSNTRGQTFFYVGEDTERFRAQFSRFGVVLLT